MRRLPPLNALRAFEAVARLGGVKKAGDELFVTHGAISRHLKQLEAWLGVSLFDRSQRSLMLREVGEAYRDTISSALDLLQEGTSRVQHYEPANTLGITTTHSIATKWLLDKLPLFGADHPEVEVWLSVEQGLTNFDKIGVDVALRMGEGPWPEMNCLPLMTDRLIPVCSPRFLSATSTLSEPEDLSNHMLLHDKDPAAQWHRWAAENGVTGVATNLGPRYSSSDILINMAMSGQGIALVSEVLAAEDLAKGRLVQALPQSVELGEYFWLLTPTNKSSKPNVKIFSDWIENNTHS